MANVIVVVVITKISLATTTNTTHKSDQKLYKLLTSIHNFQLTKAIDNFSYIQKLTNFSKFCCHSYFTQYQQPLKPSKCGLKSQLGLRFDKQF